MFAEPTLIDRSMTTDWVRVSGKGIELIHDGGQIYHHIPRPVPFICHLPDPPCFSLVTNLQEKTVPILYSTFQARISADTYLRNGLKL